MARAESEFTCLPVVVRPANYVPPDSDLGPTYPKETLENLSLDILLPVFELLRPDKDLRSLSVTCKWVREACAPVLFRSCAVHSWRLTHGLSESFPPLVLWKHVRSFRFIGKFYFDDRCSTYRPAHEGHELSFSISETLQSFPLLNTIIVALTADSGIPWNVLEAIVSVSRLHCLNLEARVVGPESLPPRNLMETVAPLTKIRYRIDDFREDPRYYQGEDALFIRLATAARATLESITMPSECFPYGVVYSNNWPQLRELHLTGLRIVVYMGKPGLRAVTPLISVLARLPSLRILRLHLAQPRQLPEREMIWPHNFVGGMPWPQLETLSVSHPHPDDHLYGHLPQSVRRLSLRCWPRHYVTLIEQEARKIYNLKWTSPVLRSSEMLHLLRRCASPHIMELDIEFKEDDEDLDLFGYIAKGFPNLVSLTVHRYRAQGRYEIPVEAIAGALAPLDHLVSLRVHLDFKNMPHPFAVFNSHGKEEFENFEVTQEAAANVFAQSIPSLKVVYLLERAVCEISWIPFEVSGAGSVSKLPVGSCYREILHSYDDKGPFYAHRSGGPYVVDR